MSKRLILAVSLLVLTPIFIISTNAAAAGNAKANQKAVKQLVGEYAKAVEKMKGDKEFANKRVLLVVGAERKATTVGGLISAVKLALSEPQHSIFIDPLVLAESQQMGYAKIDVSGAFVSGVDLEAQPPAETRGLAVLVLDYEGDTTLPLQVLANITPE